VRFCFWSSFEGYSIGRITGWNFRNTEHGLIESFGKSMQSVKFFQRVGPFQAFKHLLRLASGIYHSVALVVSHTPSADMRYGIDNEQTYI
jgi:hypothetical protein